MNLKHGFLSGITIEIGSIIIAINLKIIKVLLKDEYDIVILSGMSDLTSMIAACLCKIKGVRALVYSEGTKDGQSTLGRLLGPWEMFLLKSTSGMILPGSSSKQFYVERGMEEERIFIAPDAVDNDHYVSELKKWACAKVEIKKDFGLEDSVTLLFVGQLIHRKGVDTLIQAYHQAKAERSDLHLVIVGDGPEKGNLQKYCEEHKISDVHFLGWIDEDSKSQAYIVADVFVLPTRFDVWGLVINEAMCFKLPIIASTKAGASQDLVIDGVNGYRVPPNNVSLLKEAILKTIENRDLQLKMGQESFKRVTQFHSIEAEADGFILAINKSEGG
ncbi:hypothetical protein AOA80_04570 [Methanomassiliicoccales archaeon RumEn M1]|nr:hypothetical protein AOA80_04570 [Methanomassiliicoccales archaeon RumEn M1]